MSKLIQVTLSFETYESAVKALAYIGDVTVQFGAATQERLAPESPEAATPPAPAEKPKRTRRTKAEMEAARAAEEAAKREGPADPEPVEEPAPAPAPSPAPTSAQAEPEPEAEPEPVEEKVEEVAAPALDYAKDVRPLALKLSREKGVPALVALLAEFGVSNGQELDVAQLPAVQNAIKKALTTAPTAEGVL